MVAQTSVAGECWDGSIAQVAIFFSPVSSPRIREQCIGRIFRSGQKEETLAYYFAMVGSIDFKILSNKEKRQSFVSSVIEFLKENGGKI
jgi:SNF2 family DNA or RNA helicase